MFYVNNIVIHLEFDRLKPSLDKPIQRHAPIKKVVC